MITFTPEALARFKELKMSPEDTILRLFVRGGGCSGFQYGMVFEDAKDITDNDQRFEQDGFVYVIDPISISYLKGSEISWDDMRGFSFKNPNATAHCGCGNSFTA